MSTSERDAAADLAEIQARLEYLDKLKCDYNALTHTERQLRDHLTRERHWIDRAEAEREAREAAERALAEEKDCTAHMQASYQEVVAMLAEERRKREAAEDYGRTVGLLLNEKTGFAVASDLQTVFIDGPGEIDLVNCIKLREAAEAMAVALEHLSAPDMWEQVEGYISGPDCPDGHQDPLIWVGADAPEDIGPPALAAYRAIVPAREPGKEQGK
jgi:hypothetical protein